MKATDVIADFVISTSLVKATDLIAELLCNALERDFECLFLRELSKRKDCVGSLYHFRWWWIGGVQCVIYHLADWLRIIVWGCYEGVHN